MMFDNVSSMGSCSKKTPQKLEKIDQKTSLKPTTQNDPISFLVNFPSKKKTKMKNVGSTLFNLNGMMNHNLKMKSRKRRKKRIIKKSFYS
jgi:hypothetical protein